MSYVLRNQSQFSKEVVQFSMAIFIASSLGLLVNIYMKVSMHAISMGIMLAFMALLSFTQPGSYTFYISIAFLIAGLVCTARFIVSDHTQTEIYAGLLAGIACPNGLLFGQMECFPDYFFKKIQKLLVFIC